MRYIDDLVKVISDHLPADVKIENVQYLGDTRVVMSVSKEIPQGALSVSLEDFDGDDLKPETCDGIVNDFAKSITDELSNLNLVQEEFSVSPFGFGGGVHLTFVDGEEFYFDSDLKVLAEILVYDPAEVLAPGDGPETATFSASDLDAAAEPDTVPVSDAAPAPVDDTDEDEYADRDVEEPVSEDIDFKALAEKYLGPDEDEDEDPNSDVDYTDPIPEDETEELLDRYYDETSGMVMDDPWEDTLDYVNTKHESVQEAFEIYDCFSDQVYSGDHEGDCLDMISAKPEEGYVDPKSGEPCNRVEPSEETEKPVHMVDTARGQEIETHTKKETREKSR